MVAVGDDCDLAWPWAIVRELFGGVVFFGLLVAADEEDGAGDFLGVLQQIEGVGQAV